MTQEDERPITGVLWRPPSKNIKSTNVLVTCSADGTLRDWHAISGKVLHTRRDSEENQIFCMDFNHDGTLLAVVGRDRHVHIYDETTKSLAFKMKEAGDKTGHSNRIFAPNLILMTIIWLYQEDWTTPLWSMMLDTVNLVTLSGDLKFVLTQLLSTTMVFKW